ncbi:ATP-dependent DNA helicase 2 subunit [Raphidocelis subcapitata]|uniref:ATP-dependent DNA helicase 2 subunit n=1 Tax=Raphidocelis subcapitata TaxID=307507 RepID=A0A2V0PNR8_9CHLO|nr:ATP-dependent DNA helicase 2 subunit [Raphidocelis subcapitata]|eukprot:GBF98795.1 ATP-dependent DNA helicase 2 subunit [Raphidocelis subcapitata]
MSNVGKELHFVLLDVGPDMRPYAAEAGRNLFNLATARLLNKPVVEMAVVYFGTTETNNELNREFAAQGDDGQYTCIVTAHELACASLGTLRSLERPPEGEGFSDWVNALLLAIDMLKKAEGKFNLEKWPRRISLISTFTQPVDADEDTLVAIRDGLKASRLALEVHALGEPTGEAAATRDANLRALDTLKPATPVTMRLAPRPGDAAGMYQAVSKEGNAAYSGPLELGGGVTINVKVYKKTNPEPVTYNCSSWELKRYVRPQEGHRAEDCWVERTNELRVATELEGSVVRPEETVPAYKYGRQSVPIAPEEEELLGYAPEKGAALLGFVDASGDDAVPRHWLGCSQTKGCFVVLGEKEGDQVAVSALARAMSRERQHAVVRAVFRAKSAPGLYLATPLVAPPAANDRAGGRELDALVLNRLPFSDDFRAVLMPSFVPRADRPDPPKPKPAEAAAEAAAAAAAAGAAATADAEAGRAGVFQLGEGGARVVTAVGTGAPVEDFRLLLQAGHADEAFSGMQAAIPALVANSVGDQLYPKALACLSALRAACLERGAPGHYNSLLTQLMDRFEGDPTGGAFVRALLQSGAAPISTAEVAAAGAVAPGEAAAFVARGRRGAAPVAAAVAAEEEEDEFAGME